MRRFTAVAATWRTSTRVPTALSPASKYGLIALSAAFSIAMIMTGVESTAGSVASLNRLARCSGNTTMEKEPCAPVGMARMRSPLSIAAADQDPGSAGRGTLRAGVHRVQRLAGCHKQPVALGPAEAHVAADLWQ